MSNGVFNFNFLALVFSEILGGSQIYTKGPYAPWTLPSGEFFLPKASTSQYLIVFLISTFLLQFPRFYGVLNLRQGALCPPVRLRAENFCTRGEYVTISNGVFNFNFLALSLFYFPRYQGVPNLHQGALRPLDAPQRKNFLTQSEYFTMSNCVFNFNILALVLFGIGGPKFTLGGPALPGGPLA